MLKKVSYKDLILPYKEKDFENTTGEQTFEPFAFQEKARFQIELALKNPQFFSHFLLIGQKGLGQVESLKALLTNQTPFVVDSYPTFSSLLGLFVSPGSFQKAEGGFLVLPISRLIADFQLYDFIRVTLDNSYIDRNYLPETNFFGSNVRDRYNQKIFISCRVILIGDEEQFEQLLRYDNYIGDIFKMKVDLDYEAKATKENIQTFVKILDFLCPKITPSGKKRLFEESLITNESRVKFSINQEDWKAIYEEASALFPDKSELTEQEIHSAIENINSRVELLKKKYQDAVSWKILNHSVSGTRLGRINALSVFTPYVSAHEYGQISIVSARVSFGTGNFINIEREVNLSGDLHDKGVFILQSYLKGLFPRVQNIGLDISILFEQNQSVIDGDSASAAELLACLSALSGVEIPCDLAITGSMSQYGEIQAVGVVSLKIESWFDMTRLLGNSRSVYRVFVPEANLKDLILPRKILDSVKKGKFLIKSYSHISDVVPEIFGIKMGKIESNGKYTEGSLLRKIEEEFEKEKKY